MSLRLINRTYFKEKENFEGQKEKILIIDCDNCPEKNSPSLNYKKCFKCILKNLYLHKNRNLSGLEIKKNEILIDKSMLKKFYTYFKILNKIKKEYKKIESVKKRYCIYQDFGCKLYNKDLSLISLTPNDFFDPILIFLSIKSKVEKIEKTDILDPICLKCSYKFNKNLINIIEYIENLDLIKDLKQILKQNENSNDFTYIYKNFLGIKGQIESQVEKVSLKEEISTKKLIELYKVGEYGLFDVYIHEIPFEYEKRYSIRFLIDISTQNDYQEKLIKDIASNINLVDLENTIPLENLIKIYQIQAIPYINNKYDFNPRRTEKIAFLSSLHKLNLLKLFPLLVDDKIEEIFLDSPIDKIYINHQEYGRCRTDLSLSIKEIDRIKTLLRLYSGKRLDYSNPSLKFVIKNKYFYCRFAIDIAPINLNNFGMAIRKLNKNIFTIQDLLKLRSLNPIMAGFIYFCILRRINITVTGETDTGKTTLINALDLLVPKEYRKIYIEDITESLNQSQFQRHQIKFKVDSVESMVEKKYSKQNQIKNLLHRTPDIIYLGEILTREEAEAMFHCLAAGLRGFQTIHSKDLNSLVNRFLYHFNINRSCLNDLGLLILMKKGKDGRKIVSISEITKMISNSNNLHNLIFIFNPETLNWDQNSEMFKSKAITQLKMIESLSFKSFKDFIAIYKEIFEFLLLSDKLNNEELLDLFDKINYFSYESYDSLREYWYDWKNYRTLNH